MLMSTGSLKVTRMFPMTSCETLVTVGDRQVSGRLWQAQLPGSDVPVYLVEQPDYYERDDASQGRGLYHYTLPNGQKRDYSWDRQGRLTDVTNSDHGGGVLASYTYGYDFDWATNAYTMLGQRTSVYVDGVSGTNLEFGNTKYRFDALYQLTRVDHPNGQFETWTYDAIGNRTSANGTAYDYYKNGQNTLNGHRLRTDHPGWPDYLYDANGNVKGPSNLPNTYVWDYAGRLSASSGMMLTYDYFGRRRTATTGNSTTKYISYGPHTVGERNTTAGVATDYLFGPGIDEPLAKIVASGAVSYYGVDGLGSVTIVTNAPAIGPRWLQGWNRRILERHESRDGQRFKALLEGRGGDPTAPGARSIPWMI